MVWQKYLDVGARSRCKRDENPSFSLFPNPANLVVCSRTRLFFLFFCFLSAPFALSYKRAFSSLSSFIVPPPPTPPWAHSFAAFRLAWFHDFYQRLWEIVQKHADSPSFFLMVNNTPPFAAKRSSNQCQSTLGPLFWTQPAKRMSFKCVVLNFVLRACISVQYKCIFYLRISKIVNYLFNGNKTVIKFYLK